MTQDTHDQARQWIALGADLSTAQQQWLRAHLDECALCRDYAEAKDRLLRSLKSLPVTADTRLVRATQMRVRFHAARLREARERMWLVAIASLCVGLSATLTLPFLWRVFAWMGEQAGVSALVWQAGFVVFFMAPALVVSVLLLARGTHVKSHEEGTRHW